MTDFIGWGEFFALASALGWAISVILLRHSGYSLPAFDLNLFKMVLAFVLFLPTLLVVHGLVLPDYTVRELALVLVSGFLGIAVADTWYLRALHLVGASRTGIVASLLSPFVILLSVIFLDESLLGWQILGFALVMAGILLVTWRRARSEVEPEQVGKGIMFALGSVFLMAVGVVMVKQTLEVRPFIWTVELRLLGGLTGMFVYIVMKRRWAQVKSAFSGPLPWAHIIAGSFLGGYLSMMMWLAGYRLISASEASVLNESANAWIVLLAWLFLGESLGLRKLTGLVLTMIGVMIMVLA
jgi:drug/metabolite transporter (DMT)-like permease